MSDFWSKHKEKQKSIIISTRVREDITKILDNILESTGIHKRDFIEIALIEHCLRFDIDLKYEGIDFKKYLEVLKYEKLRRYQAKIRASIMSRALFMNRVRYNLLKLISYHASVKDIKEYLDELKKETKLYPDCEILINQFGNYLKSDEINYKRMKDYLKKQITEEDTNSSYNMEYETMLLKGDDK